MLRMDPEPATKAELRTRIRTLDVKAVEAKPFGRIGPVHNQAGEAVVKGDRWTARVRLDAMGNITEVLD